MAPMAVADQFSSTSTSPFLLPAAEERHVHGMKDRTALQAVSHGDICLPGIPKFVSFSAQRQWQLEHLAAAYRHFDREGYVFGYAGHISCRDPELTNCIWLNPLGKHFGLLRASDMVLVNIDDGKIVGGNKSLPANAAGYLIHAPIHKTRPDAHAIAHCHSRFGKAWSVFGKPLEMLTQDACKFYKQHTVYNEFGGTVYAEEEGQRIAEALGDNKAVILRNHGLLTVGQTVDEAAFLYTTFEKACEGQLLAEAAAANGLSKIPISDKQAQYVYDMESDPDACYAEFQTYFDYEDFHTHGHFRT